MKKFICIHCGATEYNSHDNGEPCQRCMGRMVEVSMQEKSEPSCYYCEHLILDGFNSWCEIRKAGEVCEDYKPKRLRRGLNG